MSIQPEILAWLRQAAALECSITAQVLLNLLERVEALERRPIPGSVELAAPAPEAAPVATDEELLELADDSDMDRLEGERSIGGTVIKEGCWEAWDHQLLPFARAIYNLGRQHGAAQHPPAALPVALSDALIKAECALSDVAEGEPECDEGDPAQWAEQRCAETLAIIRPVMQQHKIRTSEWPPVSHPTTPVEPAADRVLVSCPETCWVEIRRIADGKIIYSNHRKGELVIPVGEPPAGGLDVRPLLTLLSIGSSCGGGATLSPEQCRRVVVLLERQYSAPPPSPAGGLVEKVEAAIRPIPGDPNLYRSESRAAIREVAAWLDRYGCHGCSLWLREEIDRA
jgi:hypothetical protein